MMVPALLDIRVETFPTTDICCAFTVNFVLVGRLKRVSFLKHCQRQQFVFINGATLSDEAGAGGGSRLPNGDTLVSGGPPVATQARRGCARSPPLPLSAAFQNPLQAKRRDEKRTEVDTKLP